MDASLGDVMSEAVVDCDNCKNHWFCCRAVRAELDENEVDNFQHEQALRERKGVRILAQHNGRCVYLNPKTKKCTIWDKRPRVCREYDCANDARVADIIGRNLLKPLDNGGNCRVIISIAVLEENDERKVSPMMIYSKSGPASAETFEVRGRGEQVIASAKRLLDLQLKELLGDMGEP
jgi:hypothetical protein